MCGHPQCPQISDLTSLCAEICSVQHCSLVCSLQWFPAHYNYPNLHHAFVHQYCTFLNLRISSTYGLWGSFGKPDLIQSHLEADVRDNGSGCGQARLSWTEAGFPGDFPVSSAPIPSPPGTFKHQINFVSVSYFMLYSFDLGRNLHALMKSKFIFPIPACLIQFNYFGNLFIHCAKCIFLTIIQTTTDLVLRFRLKILKISLFWLQQEP